MFCIHLNTCRDRVVGCCTEFVCVVVTKFHVSEIALEFYRSLKCYLHTNLNALLFLKVSTSIGNTEMSNILMFKL